MISGLAAANISFYFQTGAEIHWRQAHSFHRDAASVKTLLTGLTGIVIGEVIFTATAWFATPYLYNWVRAGVRILRAAVEPAFVCCKRRSKSTPKTYERVAYDDWDEENGESEAMLGLDDPTKPLPPLPESSQKRKPGLLLRIIVGVAFLTLIALRIARPSENAYTFLSQTVIITPFERIERNQTSTVDVPELPGDWSWLFNHTALGEPPKFDWLPEKKLKGGFRDWYTDKHGKKHLHYDPAKDPLKISNLDNEILEPLREALKGDVKIKHVFLLKLESTRADVFPLRKESYLGELIQKSYGGEIPEEVEERLANLTRNAQRYTNTPSGFNGQDTVNPYGGMYMRNAYTGDTFTLKSITASVCGVAPLVADFNREYLNHIYEPCLPQVLTALNHIDNHTHHNQTTDDFRTWPWHSTFMQSITDDYDNQDKLIPVLGFKDKITDVKITEDYEHSNKTTPEKYNFWGYRMCSVCNPAFTRQS
jgi:hypothetical protein